MKKFIILLIAIVSIPFFQSCDEDKDDIAQPKSYNASLAEVASLQFAPITDDAPTAFQYNYDLQTGNAFWAITDLEYNVNLSLGEYEASDISKIDLYVFAEEIDGETYKYLGGDQGKLLKTINAPSDEFQITVSKDELATLYANEFSPEHNGDILTDDVFEIKWVITGKDGSTLDTRKDCYDDFNCSYGFGAKTVYVDTWVGEFQYNWIDIGPDTVVYSWAKVGANPKGIVVFSESGTEGQYNLDDLSCGGAYKEPDPGYITYNADANELSLTSTHARYNSKWELVSLTPTVLTVKWTYYYTQFYPEYGTFEIIRNDGLSWPENLTIVSN
ncbi:hypothetical protein [Tamlana sp. I1]|uniref:hypothetical protein n=1 Tax=Tamlana sp. I1 TaxID=2762061 RepID=UPI0018900B64|nr:hypothetical protein [Tamlana sp. I1]